MHAHLSAHMREDLDIGVVKFDAEPGIRKVFDHGPFDLDPFFFVGLRLMRRVSSTHYV